MERQEGFKLDYRAIFDSLVDPVMVLDDSQTIIAANPATARLLDLPMEKVVGSKCYELFHGAEKPPGACPNLALICSKTPSTRQMELEVAGIVCLVTVAPITDEKGRIVGSVHVAKDITDLKKHSRELGRMNRALSVLSACNQAMIRAEDEKALLNEVCRIAVEKGGYLFTWVGYKMEDPQRSVVPVASYGADQGYLETLKITWSDTPLGRGPTGTAIRTGKPVVCRDIPQDRSYRPWRQEALRRSFRSSAALPLVAEGRCIGAINVYASEPDAFDDQETDLLMELADDLTYGIQAIRTSLAHRKSRQALAESEAKYRALISTASDAILLADALTGEIIDANEAAARMLGRPKEEIVGMHHTEMYPPEGRAEASRLFQEAADAGKGLGMELLIQRADGATIPVQVSSNVVVVSGRKVLQGIFRDMSELKRAEARLRQAQRLEALGTLAGGIAHDFNNLLTPILGYSELARMDLKENHPAQEKLKAIYEAANKARGLVRQILSFARQDRVERHPLMLQPLIKESVKFLKASIPPSIEVRWSISDECGPVVADPTEIHQVIMNLCTNACQAMEKRGGILTIRLERVEAAAPSRPDQEEWGEGNWVHLEVTDTGEGIPPKMRERIFEPYFTTKPMGKGTGLGLAVVHGIVSSCGGRIEVESEPSKGTTVHVFLPEAETSRRKTTDGPGECPPGTGRILLVEDEPEVAEVTATMLKKSGYGVTTAANGHEVMELLDRGERFDLVLTDYTMPRISGVELARRIKEAMPEVPIILLTGRVEPWLKADARESGIQKVLVKPITCAELTSTVHGILKK